MAGSAPSCQTCGQSLSAVGAGEAHRRPLPAAAGLVGVLVALVAVLWLLSLTGNDSADIDGPDSNGLDEGPFEVPATSSPLRDIGSPVEVASEGEELPSAAPAEPFSGLEGWLVYLSGSHVVRLDLATEAVERLPIEMSGSVLALADLTMLTDGKRTVGLSLTEDPPTAVLVASDAQLVPSDQPLVDFWVISRPHGPDGAIRLNAWQDYGVLTGELQAQELRLLDVGGYGRPRWSDDSTSIAWLTTDRTPALVVALTEPPEQDKGWLIVELSGLGADPAPGTSFLLDSTLSWR